MEEVGLRCQVSSFDPRLFFVFRKVGGVVGAFTSRIYDILGCGEPGVLTKSREFSEYPFGAVEPRGSSLVHVGMELLQCCEFPEKLAEEEFTRNLKPLPAARGLVAGGCRNWVEITGCRNCVEIGWKLGVEIGSKLRQRILGGNCRLATVSRPDICARLARIASGANSLNGSDVYRINDLVKSVKVWQHPRRIWKEVRVATSMGKCAPGEDRCSVAL